ncbi:hypothetical protein Skr01_45570 [Sphaerisporangium krabiense]|uniref:Uncharacterized protein n=1 Tax=Sphaerisporangium krabiense TaxID=763782 RepID=A0A7W8Z4T3_9ACTN|nr:hypothetical protein [Sphaerisporangium krabiense]MBB5627392.1 hypothetical protein [Sphaerisporangium krabiense]GII64472.1 hypothetical protein Skr01_45570 [Sphaerisporangium krabiense]
MLPIWAAALWGLAGGLCVEGLELYARIRRDRKWSWKRPIPQGRAAYLTSVAIRAGVGAVLAAAATEGRQISGAFAALALGLAAPLVVEKVTRLVVHSLAGSGTLLNAPAPTTPPAASPASARRSSGGSTAPAAPRPAVPAPGVPEPSRPADGNAGVSPRAGSTPPRDGTGAADA